MSPRTFITADTHFCHDLALEFRRYGDGSPMWHTWEDMNEELVYRWNQVVRPQDTVWHLGDVALCSGEEFKKTALDDVLLRLNGFLKLVGGNHDHRWIAPYFEEVYGVREWKGCVLSHMPVHPGQRERYRANIHGHLHGSRVMLPEELVFDTNDDGTIRGIDVVEHEDPFYLCVSVEQWDYAPVEAAEIRHQLAQRN